MKGMIMMIAAGGAVSDSWANRLMKDATSAAGRSLYGRFNAQRQQAVSFLI